MQVRIISKLLSSPMPEWASIMQVWIYSDFKSNKLELIVSEFQLNMQERIVSEFGFKTILVPIVSKYQSSTMRVHTVSELQSLTTKKLNE